MADDRLDILRPEQKPEPQFLDRVEIDAPVEGKFRIPDLEDPTPLPLSIR
jgi:hypothetical protein